MASPQFPGQQPGRSGLDQLRKQQEWMRQNEQRRREMAAWHSSQRTIDEGRPGDRSESPPVPQYRLGFFGRLIRFLLTVTFFTASVLAATVAVIAFGEDDTQGALFAAAAAVISLLLVIRVRRWGRS